MKRQWRRPDLWYILNNIPRPRIRNVVILNVIKQLKQCFRLDRKVGQFTLRMFKRNLEHLPHSPTTSSCVTCYYAQNIRRIESLSVCNDVMTSGQFLNIFKIWKMMIKLSAANSNIWALSVLKVYFSSWDNLLYTTTSYNMPLFCTLGNIKTIVTFQFKNGLKVLIYYTFLWCNIITQQIF